MPSLLRFPRGLATGLLVALLGWMAFSSSAAFAQTSIDMGIELKVSDVLTAVPCSIRVAAGHTVTGDLNDCVSGGQGVRHFGPTRGPNAAPDGGTITIHDDGSFTYTAGPNPVVTTFPFTATEGSLTSPIPGVVDVTIYMGLQGASPTFHVTPGTVITGNLNDYVTGGFGTRHFGPTGAGMPTLSGGTVTIEADGSFTYVAPGFDTDDSFPFTVIDESTADPVQGTAFIEVRGDSAITPTPSPIATVTPAATSTAEATPVTTVKIKTLPTTGSGTASESASTVFDTKLQAMLLLIVGTIGLGAMCVRRHWRRPR